MAHTLTATVTASAVNLTEVVSDASRVRSGRVNRASLADCPGDQVNAGGDGPAAAMLPEAGACRRPAPTVNSSRPAFQMSTLV